MKALVAAAAVAGALALATALLLPSPAMVAVTPDFRRAWPIARGAYHVHSERSDGTGTLDEIAAAAAAAGLQFVVVTDHGNGTRAPEPPSYRAGVLCIDAVEISTDQGHLVALGLPQTPYPLAGHPRDVLDDVHRFGGIGFAAHPGSPKPALRWTDWEAPIDGLEWLNADSEWRDEFLASLGATLLTYAVRPVETLGALLDRPTPVLQPWDRLTGERRVPAIAGADAHARLGFRQGSDPYQDRVLARLPSYEVSFRAFVNHVILDRPLSGDAPADAAAVIDSVREGRVFTSIDSLAGLSALEMLAISGQTVVRPGDYLDIDGPVALSAQIAAPPGTRLTVVRDGTTLYETREPALRLDLGRQPGAYRVEAFLAGQRPGAVPWVLTNPIYVGLRARHQQRATISKGAPATSRAPVATAAWTAEASAGSISALTVTQLDDGTPALSWRYQLAPGAGGQQYAAIRFPLDASVVANDRLQLRVRSDAPHRIWAQLRAPGTADGERWGRTLPIDRALSALELRFDEFRPLGPVAAPRPPRDRVDSLLLVVDTLNNEPGAGGTIWITDLWLAK